MGAKFPVADAHSDFLYYMVHDKRSIDTIKGNQAVSLPYMHDGGAALQFFAAWVDPDDREDPVLQCLSLIDAYHIMLKKNADTIVQFDDNFLSENGKIAALLTIEGGEALGGKICNVRNYYRLGVRAMTLTWNASNELASPAMSRLNRGLTRLGKRVVEEMNAVGMAVDTAHLSDAGIDDILKITKQPIFSSHTNARSICEHKRSLSDRHIRAIADMGGVICVNYYPPQLTKIPRHAAISDIARHIMHIRNVGGTECVALGSDFDGMNEYPIDIKNWSHVPNLIDALIAKGINECDVRKIAYDNLRRYIGQFCR